MQKNLTFKHLLTVTAMLAALTACSTKPDTTTPTATTDGTTQTVETEAETEFLTSTSIPGVSIMNTLDSTKPNPALTRNGAQDTLVVGISAATMNRLLPVYYATNYDRMATELIFGTGLINNDDSGNVIFDDYATAKSYEISEDGTTYTFTLKEGLVFSDGTPLTAYDVEHTYTMMCDPSYDGRNISSVNELVGYDEYNKGDATSVAGIQVIDDNTISFTYQTPKSANIWNFTYGIMSKEHYKMEKGEFENVKTQMANLDFMGSGPYKYSSLSPDQFISFEYNENFKTDKIPQAKNLVMAFTSVDTMYDEFNAGTYDMLIQVPSNNDNLQKITNGGIGNIRTYPANSYGFMMFNLENEILSDVTVRQALTYGFNREIFVNLYYNGYSSVTNSPISKVSWAYSPVPNEYPYNPEEANKLLDEAGWVMGADGYRTKDGEILEIKWDTYTDSKYVEYLIPMLTDDWKKIGVKLTVNLMDFNSMTEKVFDRQDFMMCNLAWALNVDPSGMDTTFMSEYSNLGDNNAGHYSNTVVDAALTTAGSSFDQQERIDNYKIATDEINKDAPYIFINQNDEWTFVNGRVMNFNSSPFRLWHTQVLDVTF